MNSSDILVSPRFVLILTFCFICLQCFGGALSFLTHTQLPQHFLFLLGSQCPQASCPPPAAPSVPVGRLRADLPDLPPQAFEAPVHLPPQSVLPCPFRLTVGPAQGQRQGCLRALAVRLQTASAQGLPLRGSDPWLEPRGAHAVTARLLVSAHSFGEGATRLFSQPSEPCLWPQPFVPAHDQWT